MLTWQQLDRFPPRLLFHNLDRLIAHHNGGPPRQAGTNRAPISLAGMRRGYRPPPDPDRTVLLRGTAIALVSV